VTEIYRVEVHHCRGAQESAVPINSSTDHTRLLTPAAIAAVILNETSNASAAKDLGQLRASEAGTGSALPCQGASQRARDNGARP